MKFDGCLIDEKWKRPRRNIIIIITTNIISSFDKMVILINLLLLKLRRHSETPETSTKYFTTNFLIQGGQ